MKLKLLLLGMIVLSILLPHSKCASFSAQNPFNSDIILSGRKVRIWRPESVSNLRSDKTIVSQGLDIIGRLEDTSVMADIRVSRRGATLHGL